MGSRCLGTEKTAQAQIAQFDHAVSGDKDIGWFDISVHDPLVVHMLEGATKLNKVLPNGSFGYEATLLLEMFDHLS